MNETLKVLHVEMGRHFYGGALQAFHLIQGLGELGCSNVLVCPRGSAIAEHARDAADRVHAVPMAGEHDVRMIGRLWRIIRKERPDLVHLHSRRGADMFGGIAARLENVPAVLSRRVDNPEPRWWTAMKYRLHDRVVTVSEEIRAVLIRQGVAPEKIVRVYSGVDFARYGRSPTDGQWFEQVFALPPATHVIGMVAQLIKRKGHRYLIDAMPEVLTSYPQTHLLIFGEGALEEEIRGQIENLGLEHRITMAGFRHDLDRIYAHLDVLVHPATMEGLGNGLLQAACAGVPIVASRAGGLPEVVRDEINGLLVPPRDSGAIARAIRRLLSSNYLRAAMGRQGQALVRREFSIDAMVEGNLAVYCDLLNIDQRRLTRDNSEAIALSQRFETRQIPEKRAA